MPANGSPPTRNSQIPQASYFQTAWRNSGSLSGADISRSDSIGTDIVSIAEVQRRTSTESVSHNGLIHLLKSRKIKDTVRLTAISATCHKVAVLTFKKFWVFETHQGTLVCAGEFVKDTKFKYASKGKSLGFQHPVPDQFIMSPFSCVALSDSYLAIGAPGRVMVFSLKGDYVGRWVVYHE